MAYTDADCKNICSRKLEHVANDQVSYFYLPNSRLNVILRNLEKNKLKKLWSYLMIRQSRVSPRSSGSPCPARGNKKEGTGDIESSGNI